MTELIRIDFKAKKLIGRHELGELAKKEKVLKFSCICCGNSYNNDTSSGAYCKAVSWQVPTKKQTATLHLCKHCIEEMATVIMEGE